MGEVRQGGSSRPPPRVRAVLLTAAIGVLAGAAMAQGSAPDAPAASQETAFYSIPPGPLGSALHRFAAASGAFIVADGALTLGRSTEGVKGHHPTGPALALLLRGTGLDAERRADGSWVIRSAPDSADAPDDNIATLPTVRVTARDENAGRGIGGPDTNVAGGMPRPANELALSISVITRRRIETQSLTDLQQALEQSTGVTTRHVDNSRYRVYARGFQLDGLQIDGVTASIGYLTPPDLAIYEQVEVAGGPASVATGLMTPGGTMNLVRKRPTEVFKAQASIEGGTRLPSRRVADIGGPIGRGGAVRGRFVAAGEDRDAMQQGASRRKTQFYAVFEADVGTGALLRMGANRERMGSKSMQYGYPTHTDGRFLSVPWSTYYGADWNTEQYALDSAFADLALDLPGAWQGRLAALVLHSRRSSAFAGLSGAVEPYGTRSSYRTSRTMLDDRQRVLDARVQGPVSIAHRTHRLLLGAYAQDQRAPQATTRGQPRRIEVDLARPQPVAPVEFPQSGTTAYDRRARQLGAYGSAEWSLTDRWSLVTGTRVLSWRSAAVADSEHNAAGKTGGSDHIGTRMSSSAAVMRSFGDDGLAYASLAQAITPQSLRGAGGRLLPPLRATQREIGLKGSAFDGKLAASVAWFEIDQRNRAVFVGSDADGAIRAPRRWARSRGVVLQVDGRAGPDLAYSAGYTLTLSRALDASAATGPLAATAYAPRHLLKAWGVYRLAQDWHVGAALQATSGYASQDGAAWVRQHGFAVASAWAEYAWSRHTSIKLHIGNLFDRRYYASLGTTRDHNFPGETRSATLAVRIQY